VICTPSGAEQHQGVIHRRWSAWSKLCRCDLNGSTSTDSKRGLSILCLWAATACCYVAKVHSQQAVPSLDHVLVLPYSISPFNQPAEPRLLLSEKGALTIGCVTPYTVTHLSNSLLHVTFHRPLHQQKAPLHDCVKSQKPQPSFQ
jgi:hypothetical protein